MKADSAVSLVDPTPFAKAARTTDNLMQAYSRSDFEPVRGEVCHMFDTDGRRYLDFLAGVAVNALAILVEPVQGEGGVRILPAAVLATEAVDACVTPGSHGSTLGGAPLAIAVAGAVLDVPQVVAEVRGVGLMIGLRCAEVSNARMIEALRANGLLSAPAGANVVRLLPPLIIEGAHVAEAVAAVDGACRALDRRQAA